MEISLEGKVALVTGVGPNIGSGIALALSKYGAKVACNDMSEEAVDACVKRIERNGGTAMRVVGDVTREDDVRGYVDDILAAWGKIDILVNNAAIMSGFASVLDETAERFSRSLLVSGLGNLLNTKYVARSMAERGIRGSIVCISSSSGWTASPGYISYSYQKGGVNNFVRGAAMELAPYGIRVNGYTPTSPTPDNPELIAAKAAAAAGNGGSVRPAEVQREERRGRALAAAGPLGGRAAPADPHGHHRHAYRHRPLRGLDQLRLRAADHRLRLRGRRRGQGQEPHVHTARAGPDVRPGSADRTGHGGTVRWLKLTGRGTVHEHVARLPRPRPGQWASSPP